MNRGKRFAILMAAMIAALITMPAQADPRLVSREYNADEVVRIDGKIGVQATIGFAAKESIENVAVGDSRAWQITPNKRANLLFVKPLEVSARTNMTVVTNQRTYFFDLVASPRAKPIYMLRFTYQDEEPAPDEPRGSALATNNHTGKAIDTEPAMLNFAWVRKGDAKLLPTRVYDDGAATYLLWDEKQAIPAILMRNEQGVEGPVNYAVRGRTIVIDEVPALIVLRIGKALATLENMRSIAAANAKQMPESPLYAVRDGTPKHSAIWRN